MVSQVPGLRTSLFQLAPCNWPRATGPVHWPRTLAVSEEPLAPAGQSSSGTCRPAPRRRFGALGRAASASPAMVPISPPRPAYPGTADDRSRRGGRKPSLAAWRALALGAARECIDARPVHGSVAAASISLARLAWRSAALHGRRHDRVEGPSTPRAGHAAPRAQAGVVPEMVAKAHAPRAPANQDGRPGMAPPWFCRFACSWLCAASGLRRPSPRHRISFVAFSC
jgi:hypothetical protein